MAFDQEKVLEVKDLKISFYTDNGILKAVRGVSFDLHRGETLCIVGESGSGKSVTSKAIMGILANNAIIEGGSILYEGENLLEISEEEFHRIRGKKIGMIFQDPLSSLNPIVRIGKQITEAMLINSDKLKIMYNELISSELIAYENVIAKRKINIQKEKDVCQLEIAKIQKRLANPELTAEEKVSLLEEKKALVAACKNNIVAIKSESDAQLPALKTALNSKKVEAKAKVKAYHNSLKQEYKQNVEKINNTSTYNIDRFI